MPALENVFHLCAERFFNQLTLGRAGDGNHRVPVADAGDVPQRAVKRIGVILGDVCNFADGEYFLSTTSPSWSVKISKGSPSRMRSVRRISLGITTRPSSSILRTMPVALIAIFLPAIFSGLSIHAYYSRPEVELCALHAKLRDWQFQAVANFVALCYTKKAKSAMNGGGFL